MDVSAFLLNNTGKVIGDSWFVFYGQETSPDGSTAFGAGQEENHEIISVDFNRLNPAVSRIVFVLTINEALEKHLNFSMLRDAYIKITDTSDTELVSFKMDEYYSNVTSMMIGEVYRHNGIWKFNAIGNGVTRDLAGLCRAIWGSGNLRKEGTIMLSFETINELTLKVTCTGSDVLFVKMPELL